MWINESRLANAMERFATLQFHYRLKGISPICTFLKTVTERMIASPQKPESRKRKKKMKKVAFVTCYPCNMGNMVRLGPKAADQ